MPKKQSASLVEEKLAFAEEMLRKDRTLTRNGLRTLMQHKFGDGIGSKATTNIRRKIQREILNKSKYPTPQVPSTEVNAPVQAEKKSLTNHDIPWMKEFVAKIVENFPNLQSFVVSVDPSGSQSVTVVERFQL